MHDFIFVVFDTEMAHHKPKKTLEHYENILISKSRRALIAGDFKDSVDKLRLMCLTKGNSGKRGKV